MMLTFPCAFLVYVVNAESGSCSSGSDDLEASESTSTPKPRSRLAVSPRPPLHARVGGVPRLHIQHNNHHEPTARRLSNASVNQNNAPFQLPHAPTSSPRQNPPPSHRRPSVGSAFAMPLSKQSTPRLNKNPGDLPRLPEPGTPESVRLPLLSLRNSPRQPSGSLGGVQAATRSALPSRSPRLDRMSSPLRGVVFWNENEMVEGGPVPPTPHTPFAAFLRMKAGGSAEHVQPSAACDAL